MLVLRTRSQKLERIRFAPDSRGLAAAGKRGLHWWQSLDADVKPVRFGQGECDGVGFTPDGEQIIAGFGGECISGIMLDDEIVETVSLGGQRSSLHECPDVSLAGPCSSIDVCPVTGLSVAAGWSGHLSGWRLNPYGVPTQAWATSRRPGSIGSSVAFASDGSWFVQTVMSSASGPKYRLAIHQPATGLELGTCPGDDWISCGPAVSPDKEWIAFANGSLLCTQSVSDPKARLTLANDNTHQYTGLAYHPSGRFLAATNNDKTVKIVDAMTWQLVRTFTWDIGRMRSVAFSPDGLLAAAGSDKGRVVVWDADLE